MTTSHSALSRRVHIAQVLLIVIVIVGALVVGRQIVTGSIFSAPYVVTVELPEAAGLHQHSDVSYRGQHIGSVDAVDLTDTGVRATLSINSGVKVPIDSEVVVANLSAVGEQYVDFRPRVNAGPYLAAGAKIEAGAEALPLPTYQLLAHVQSLIGRVDIKDIRTISREVQAIFAQRDEGDQVNVAALSDEIGDTLDLLEQMTPDLLTVLAKGQVPLRTMADLTPEIKDFLTNAVSITAQLKKSNPTIAKLIDQGALLVPVIDGAFSEVSPSLASLLKSGTPVAEMAKDHLRGLNHWYTYGPLQFQAMAAGTAGGHAHVILAFRVPQNCEYGPEVSPYDMKATPNLNARCTTTAPAMQQRGSQYVPRQ
jgi:phospholipid/cholesterol/gamma-HCH transport system substrate-binding protein